MLDQERKQGRGAARTLAQAERRSHAAHRDKAHYVLEDARQGGLAALGATALFNGESSCLSFW